MKEKLYTIPVNEGFEAEDECPFCAMERKAEQSAIRYYAGPGASYMEPDVRASTDKAGFCGSHMKKLYIIYIVLYSFVSYILTSCLLQLH